MLRPFLIVYRIKPQEFDIKMEQTCVCSILHLRYSSNTSVPVTSRTSMFSVYTPS